MFKATHMEYKDYGHCIHLTNGVIELVATVDVGPRIVRYGYVDGVNILNDNQNAFDPVTDDEYEKYFGKGKQFNNYGGHRLWLSPEYYPDMYYPDNDQVEVEVFNNGIILTPPPQTENKVQLRMRITLDPDDTNVTIEHTVVNYGDRVKECALWALTVAAKGGTEIIPLNTHDTGLLPNGKIELWPYTDLRTDNIYIGKKYVTIRQPQTGRLKLGFELKKGNIYYVVDDTVFMKNYYPNYPTGNYPDGGVSYETYSCDFFTELETLSELKKIARSESLTHTERWSLCKKPCDFDPADDDSIDNFINKL